MDKKTKRFRKAAVVFAAVVVVSTFFSRSLYNYRIPTVIVTSPKQGNLNLAEEGETEILAGSELQPYDVLIPASALRKDYEGYYVLVLRENQSVLGRGYVAHRMSVELLDSDQEYCAVRGLPTDEQVILTGTDVIGDGSNVYYGGAGAR